eukprot:5696189-Amphidinium_carterae.1
MTVYSSAPERHLYAAQAAVAVLLADEQNLKTLLHEEVSERSRILSVRGATRQSARVVLSRNTLDSSDFEFERRKIDLHAMRQEIFLEAVESRKQMSKKL